MDEEQNQQDQERRAEDQLEQDLDLEVSMMSEYEDSNSVDYRKLMKKRNDLEAKALKTKLTSIASRISSSGAAKLNFMDMATLKRAKKHESLKKQVNHINMILLANKVKKTTKTITKFLSSSPVAFYVLIGALLLFLIICVVVIIASIIPGLFPSDGNGSGASSQFGVTGADFYGVRMVYEDDEKATASIIEDYVELVEVGINATTAITAATKEGENFDVTVTVNIPMPAEDYNYEEFNENNFKTSYSQLYTTVFDIAKLVYKLDNNEDTTATTLVECVDGILYFGYSEKIMADVSSLISNQIISNSTFESENDDENKLTKADVDAVIQTELSSLYAKEKYNVRAQKLFVKDYILESDDAMVSNVTQENYVAMIFMPKKNVTFNYFSFVASGEDLTNFTINLTNNGSEIVLTKDDSDFTTEESNIKTNIYMSNENLNIIANAYEDIDVNNINALKDETSLFDIIEKLNYSTYLETATDENSVQYYKLKQNGVVVSLSNSSAFTFVEFETKWQAN